MFAEIACPSCAYKNADENRYCENCAAEIRDLTPEEKEIRQKNAGKIEYQGKYYTPEEYQKITTQNTPARGKRGNESKVTLISEGEEVELSKYAVKGSVTLFDFYADWCGPCRTLSPFIEALVQDNDNVFLRKINIVQWSSPVARQHQIRSIPCILVYGKTGTLASAPGHDYEKIKTAMEQALQ